MTTYQPQMPPAGQSPKRSKRRFLWPLGALVLGIGLGAASAGSAEPEIQTVEKVVEKRIDVPGPERVVEKKVEVPVEKTPQTCKDALDHADLGFNKMSEALGFIQKFDFESAEAKNAEVAALAPKYNLAKTLCRAS